MGVSAEYTVVPFAVPEQDSNIVDASVHLKANSTALSLLKLKSPPPLSMLYDKAVPEEHVNAVNER